MLRKLGSLRPESAADRQALGRRVGRIDQHLAFGGDQEHAAPAVAQARAVAQQGLELAAVGVSQQRGLRDDRQRLDRRGQFALDVLRRGRGRALEFGPHASALRHEVVVDAIAHQRDERHRGHQHDDRQVGAQRGLGPQRSQAFPQRGRRRAAQWGMPLNAGHMHALATGTAARRRALPRPRGDAGADLPMGSRRGTQPPRAMRMDEDMLAAALRAPGSSLAIALD